MHCTIHAEAPHCLLCTSPLQARSSETVLSCLCTSPLQAQSSETVLSCLCIVPLQTQSSETVLSDRHGSWATLHWILGECNYHCSTCHQARCSQSSHKKLYTRSTHCTLHAGKPFSWRLHARNGRCCTHRCCCCKHRGGHMLEPATTALQR